MEFNFVYDFLWIKIILTLFLFSIDLRFHLMTCIFTVVQFELNKWYIIHIIDVRNERYWLSTVMHIFMNYFALSLAERLNDT